MAKRPRDPNQLAKLVVDIASGDAEDPISESKKNPNRRGRAGGLKGGVARATSLSVEQRSEIAKKASKTRWKSST
jgi:hypothetical protein